jgi:hypothetical protein
VGHEIIPAWLSRLCWEYFRGAGGRQLDPLAICGALTSLNSLGQLRHAEYFGSFQHLSTIVCISLSSRSRDRVGPSKPRSEPRRTEQVLAPFVGSLGVRSLVVLPRPFGDVCKKRLHPLVDRHLMG